MHNRLWAVPAVVALFAGPVLGAPCAASPSSPSSPSWPSAARAAAAASSSSSSSAAPAPHVPSLRVPACPGATSITYNKSVPARDAFPRTTVSLCHAPTHLHVNFTAHDEEHFFFDPAQRTNGDIWQYEVMEAFIARGAGDPQTYLEFEVSPANVTYQAVVYNPTKARRAGAPFDHFFVADPAGDGFAAATRLDRPAREWTSAARIPLGLWNVDAGQGAGTQWRMNFFRTVVGPDDFPAQRLGAWSAPDTPSFHVTPFFGHVTFI